MSDFDSVENQVKNTSPLAPKRALDALQEGLNHLPTQGQRDDVSRRFLQDMLMSDPLRPPTREDNPFTRMGHMIDQSSKEKPPPPEPPAPNPAILNAHGFGSDDLLKTDPDGLLDFARKLEDKANEIEQELPAKRAKVEEAFRREARMYTKDSQVPPVFQPLGKALAVALDKLEQNVQGVTTTLRNDARLLRELVDKHDENERRAAQGFDSVGARPRG
ncbi:hypothetical protein [Mycobacteroides abscessus]|uniref:hypothetical protein n=1 Tax=Mycobacteroides abscessus TaxID=36809 RepID=UPI000928AD40|nr:hypothetical protein [Mycobacteroides abscessus]SIJ34330.1 Uncharacterised protein [Mycobacteroides abscessus subsp. abscessus]SIK92755.1 Uncharacterised protein [Mycobacteroides abscessus subsp. abscessus]SIL98350.1 Uncharacterised protein [Mycobacteroides abscessus subsp. abscessus]SLE80381.1 Uncharacterised protein [Mycobacteroides abscessus subsp. abscessus]